MLLDENKSALAEMNEINEQLPQAQKNSKNSQTKKPLCSRLNLENLCRIRLQESHGGYNPNQ
ncbi:hypothetical protein HpBT156_06460 [Helicobacter pylori]